MISDNEKKVRVALYLRVSTDEQAKEDRYGLRVQEDRLRKYCESQGYLISEDYVYRDEGRSGSLPIGSREGLKDLFEDAKLKKFDVVVVYRLDRFFRNTSKLLNAVERLLEHDIDFKSATESFDTSTPNGRFVLQMLGSLAELEREVIRERMSSGREQAAREGKWVMGGAPFGYRLDKKTKKLVIQQEEAEVVKQFFRWLAHERQSLTAITKKANELGLVSPRKKPRVKRLTKNFWWKRSVNRILVNEVYTGECYFRRYKRPFKFLESVVDKENQRPEDDWISVSVPPIIDKKTFEGAIKQLRSNKENSKRNTQHPYLYGKLLYSGYTGTQMQTRYKAPKSGRPTDSLGKYYFSRVPKI